jgi:AraC-like DNA-binding protein
VALGTRARARVWRHDGTFRAEGSAAHPGIELACLESGHAEYRIGSRSIAVGPGDVVIVPAQAEHRTHFETELRGVALWLDPTLVTEVASVVTGTDGLRSARAALGVTAPGAIPTLLGLLEQEIKKQAAGWRLAADALLEAIMVDFLRATTAAEGGRSPRDRRIAAAVEAIESRYAEELSVDDLARAANMSRFHFSRLFREEVGEAPYQHLLRVRVMRAAELLRRGHRSVTQAALDVGFHDLGRFGRVFRAQMGCLPSDMARGARRRYGTAPA